MFRAKPVLQEDVCWRAHVVYPISTSVKMIILILFLGFEAVTVSLCEKMYSVLYPIIFCVRNSKSIDRTRSSKNMTIEKKKPRQT